MELRKISYENTEICFLKGGSQKPLVQCVIEGVPTARGHEIINSAPSSKKKQLLSNWKRKIADEMNERILKPVIPKQMVVSLSFFFCASLHGKRSFDIDNFIKPVLDGVAKGLYSKDWNKERNRAKISFDEDDSIFRSMYFERHDVTNSLKESIHVTIWEA